MLILYWRCKPRPIARREWLRAVPDWPRAGSSRDSATGGLPLARFFSTLLFDIAAGDPTTMVAVLGDIETWEHILWGKTWDRLRISGKLRSEIQVSPGFAAHFRATSPKRLRTRSPPEQD